MKKVIRSSVRKLLERRASRFDRFMQDAMNQGDERRAIQYAHKAQHVLLKAHGLRGAA